MSITIISESKSMAVLVIQSVIILLIAIHNLIYGDVNFKGFKLIGKWEVGHKDIHTSKSGLAVSVYYPIDKAVHAKMMNEGKETKWLRYGASSARGITHAFANLNPD